MIYSLGEYKNYLLSEKSDHHMGFFLDKIDALDYEKSKFMGEEIYISTCETVYLVALQKEPSPEMLEVFKTFDKDVIYYVKDAGKHLLRVPSFEKILEEAIRLNASDIHIEPYHSTYRVRFRIDGELKVIYKGGVDPLTLLNIIKVRVGLDPMLKEIQEGSYSYKNYIFRVSIVPGFAGEKIVIRILSKNAKKLNLLELGYPQNRINEFVGYYKKAGINLICGQTGSGKNTTMHAILNAIADDTKNIISIEDPVEYRNKDITQLEVDTHKGRTFHKLLKSILRQDPDIIYIGEIRDEETVAVALRTAITGHTVLSTLHTKDLVSTFERLEDMGGREYLIKEAIRTITCQRLVKTLCPKCKKKSRIEEENHGILEVYEAKGCEHCEGGYKGRTAIFESYLFDKNLPEMEIGKSSIKGKRLLDYKESLSYLLRSGEIDYKTYLEYLEE